MDTRINIFDRGLAGRVPRLVEIQTWRAAIFTRAPGAGGTYASAHRLRKFMGLALTACDDAMELFEGCRQ